MLLPVCTRPEPESGQAHQHLVPFYASSPRRAKRTFWDGEAGHFLRHHVWCGAQAVSRSTGAVPPPWGATDPASECVPCRVSSPSE